MNIRYGAGFTAVFFMAIAGCATLPRTGPPANTMVDANASQETKALFFNLKKLAPDALLFGHQDDLAYGVKWWREDGRSDVKEVTGAYPAMYGWDLGDLEHGARENLDGVRFDDMKRWIREAYSRGGVSTMSWHMDNPVTGGDSWDRTPAVRDILPDGPKHAMFRNWLDHFAAFIDELNTGSWSWLGFGESIPIIFRPFHELTGSWFWWGADHCTAEEYKALWRFTVKYLRDEKGLHNLLYAYSTDRFRDEAHYLERYPGDAYVDVLGLDNYGAMGSDEGIGEVTRQLRTLVELSESRGKIAAFSETGLEGIPDEDWFTGRLLKAVKEDTVARRITYVLVWRNAPESRNPGHHYAPYPGHPSAEDFIRFYRDPFVLFENELPDLYEVDAADGRRS